MNKADAEKLRGEVLRILFEVWDPLGVSEIGEPDGDPDWASIRSEYESYEVEILSSLIGGVPEQQIASQLLQIARKNMGLTCSHVEECSNLAAKALASLRMSP